ncbi:MAG TPA: hypothetical protein VH165_27095 [Kofleriaceae bacterium]|jgi:hypothetical protein|nr:hypothetical protein [Kofleriaceae bacterium]
MAESSARTLTSDEATSIVTAAAARDQVCPCYEAGRTPRCSGGVAIIPLEDP